MIFAWNAFHGLRACNIRKGDSVLDTPHKSEGTPKSKHGPYVKNNIRSASAKKQPTSTMSAVILTAIVMLILGGVAFYLYHNSMIPEKTHDDLALTEKPRNIPEDVSSQSTQHNAPPKEQVSATRLLELKDIVAEARMECSNLDSQTRALRQSKNQINPIFGKFKGNIQNLENALFSLDSAIGGAERALSLNDVSEAVIVERIQAIDLAKRKVASALINIQKDLNSMENDRARGFGGSPYMY